MLKLMGLNPIRSGLWSGYHVVGYGEYLRVFGSAADVKVLYDDRGTHPGEE